MRSVFSWKTRALRNVLTTASVNLSPSTLLFDVEPNGDVVGFNFVAINKDSLRTTNLREYKIKMKKNNAFIGFQKVLLYIDGTLILLVVLIRGEEKNLLARLT